MQSEALKTANPKQAMQLFERLCEKDENIKFVDADILKKVILILGNSLALGNFVLRYCHDAKNLEELFNTPISKTLEEYQKIHEHYQLQFLRYR